MVSNLLSLINQEGSLGFGEACLYGLIGYLIVFLGIIIIILIIWLIGLVLRKTNNFAFLKVKKREKNNIIQEHPNVSEPVAVVAENGDIPDEVKAAIVAAIMAYYCEEKPECEFKVKRIKRI